MRRKPTAMKALAGTLRPDRVNAREPHPKVGTSRPRPGMQPAVRVMYLYLVRLLRRMPGVMCVTDVVQVELAASALVEYRTAQAVVLEKGATYEATTEAGATMHRARPEVAIAADAWRRAHNALQCLGLSPTSRPKVEGIAPPLAGAGARPDGLAEYMARKHERMGGA